MLVGTLAGEEEEVGVKGEGQEVVMVEEAAEVTMGEAEAEAKSQEDRLGRESWRKRKDSCMLNRRFIYRLVS